MGNRERKLWAPYLALLAISVLALYWYPADLLAALRGNASQGAFVAADTRNQVYFFTVAGAVISFVLVALFILKQEGFRRVYVPVALVVAYISTISVTMWYEQLYANIWDLYYHTDYWWTYYSTGFPPGYGWVFIDMVLILVAYPWMRRSNLRPALLLVLLTLLSFVAWILVGYGRPDESPGDYLFNAISRISSHLALTAAVWPGSWREKR